MSKYNFQALARRYLFGRVREGIDECVRCHNRLTIIDSYTLSKILLNKPIANKKAGKLVYDNSWYIKEPWFLRLDVPQLLCFKSIYAKCKEGIYETEAIHSEIKTLDMYIAREETEKALSNAYTTGKVDFYEFCYSLSDTPEYWERIMRDRRYAVQQIQNGYTHRQRVFYSAIHYFGFRNSLRDCVNYYIFINEKIGHQHFHEQLGIGGMAGCSSEILTQLQNRFNQEIRKVRKTFESEYAQQFYIYHNRLYNTKTKHSKFTFQCKCAELEPYPVLQDHHHDRETRIPHFIPPQVYAHRRKNQYLFHKMKFKGACKKGKLNFIKPEQMLTSKSDLDSTESVSQELTKKKSGSNTSLKGSSAKVPKSDMTWDMFFKQIGRPTSIVEKRDTINESIKSMASVPMDKVALPTGKRDKQILDEALKMDRMEMLEAIGPKIICWHHNANIFKKPTAINNMYRDIKKFKIKLPPHLMEKLVNVKKGSVEAKQLVNEVLDAYHDQMKQMFVNITMDYWHAVLSRLRFTKQQSLENFLLAFHAYSVLQKSDIHVKYPWEPQLIMGMHQKLAIATFKKTQTWNKYFSGKNDCYPCKKAQLPLLKRCSRYR